MIISTGAKKAIHKIQHSSMIKNKKKPLNTVDTERMYLTLIKAIQNNLTASIILKGENLTDFPLRSGTGQDCPLSPLLFNIGLEVLAMVVR